MTTPDDGRQVTARSPAPAHRARSRGGWVWPIDLDGWDRSALTTAEVAALRELGYKVRRPPGSDERSLAWRRIRRLLEPLHRARAVVQVPRDEGPGRRQRRAADDAVGMILWTCGQNETSFWEWSPETWAALIGPGTAAFTAPWPESIDRPHDCTS
ncbi:hypothetical protein [Pseudonocardia nigra]|uniref:hypothetical protein n=1 Tax=Pseudonocardia nigra TaxID=1921578 RepID=UPI001C60342C|nr:hypothetical protein [Pseudonocardia nigra]